MHNASSPSGTHFSPPSCAFLRRATVALTVAAAPVVRSQHPPAIVFLHCLALHFQTPADKRFTVSLPQKVHMYLA
eukprot:CAMPEP_0175523824 /NCGR_PEP_ID=MMETSP0096-20121207/18270_1 /TAXON_ID=311494 /ORGANISM="Alexandrium monilatum, Strain CCMP3105" /LENGTH=74 /DNA_ID=CAMNT_0016826377 /DNA_START=18 /DNA_END=238 /DNA_ORIENTATION=+